MSSDVEGLVSFIQQRKGTFHKAKRVPQFFYRVAHGGHLKM
jgi:hypothetical protein